RGTGIDVSLAEQVGVGDAFGGKCGAIIQVERRASVGAGCCLGRGVGVGVEANLAGSLVGAGSTAHAASLREDTGDAAAEHGFFSRRKDATDAAPRVLTGGMKGAAAPAADS